MDRDTKNDYSVFDTHCDTLCCVRDDGKSLNENDCHVDLKRMSEYKSYTQVFACFIDPIYKTCGADSWLQSQKKWPLCANGERSCSASRR